jgi:hypothetical protein
MFFKKMRIKIIIYGIDFERNYLLNNYKIRGWWLEFYSEKLKKFNNLILVKLIFGIKKNLFFRLVFLDSVMFYF